jgi:hypothetical protein
MSVIRVQHNKNYTCFGNEILRFDHVPMQKRLSLRARGLLHMMLSYPPDWKFDGLEEIIELVPEGRDAVRTAYKELKDLGYARKVRVIDPVTRRTLRWETIISEKPDPQGSDDILADELEVRRSQFTENPSSGISDDGESSFLEIHNLENHPPGIPDDGESRCLEIHNLENHSPGIPGAIQNNDLQNTDLQSTEVENTDRVPSLKATGRAIAPVEPDAPVEYPEPGTPEPEAAETPDFPVEKATKPGKAAKSGSEAKSSGAAAKAAKKQRRADQVYGQLKDREGFESFWAWYKEKICPIRARIRDRGPASPGRKVEAAEAWAELESLDFLGHGREGFKHGCYLQWQLYLTTGGADIPHACRFLYPSGGEPEWSTRIQEQGGSKEVQPFIEGPPPQPITLQSGQTEQFPAWMNAADKRLATELIEGREVMDAMYAAVDANPYLQRRSNHA